MRSKIDIIHGPIGTVWINFKEVESTNKKAHSMAIQGFKEGTVVTADQQTKGRGRRGRLWHSPEGNLYCSIILRPKIISNDLILLEKIAGLAVWETIKKFIARKPCLKAPNDVLINGKKVAGILIESRWGKETLEHIVIGVGINCSGEITSFPRGLKSRITTLYQESGHPVKASETLDVLIMYMNKWYNIFLSGEKIRILNRWEKLIQEGLSCPVSS